MAMLLQPTAAFVLIIKSAAARLDARTRVCMKLDVIKLATGTDTWFFFFFFSLFNFSFLVDFRQKFEQWKLAFNNDSINDDSRISGEEFLWIWKGSSFKIKFFEMMKKDEEFLWECSIEFY